MFHTSGFKYSERIQSEDRIHRIGQQHPVHYIELWTGFAIDQRISDALRSKDDVPEDLKRKFCELKKQGKAAVAEYLGGYNAGNKLHGTSGGGKTSGLYKFFDSVDATPQRHLVISKIHKSYPLLVFSLPSRSRISLRQNRS